MPEQHYRECLREKLMDLEAEKERKATHPDDAMSEESGREGNESSLSDL